MQINEAIKREPETFLVMGNESGLESIDADVDDGRFDNGLALQNA